MKITIVCVGRLKENYWQMAVAEYEKRLSRYCKLEIIQVSDEKAPEKLSAAQEEQVKQKEGQKILKALKEDAYTAALAIEGKSYSSQELSKWLDDCMNQGISHIAFVIGGSLGLSKEVLKQAKECISFSAMTFPHQMMRVILLEQVYRGFKILKKEPYQK